jgi:hypothetical protein
VTPFFAVDGRLRKAGVISGVFPPTEKVDSQPSETSDHSSEAEEVHEKVQLIGFGRQKKRVLDFS